MFRASSLLIISSFYCTFGTGNCHAGLMTASKQSQDGTTVHENYQRRITVETTDDEQRRCPKHV